ncbi:MAG: homocysteine biosynthesis protein [Methanomicrobiales archaeon]|nr:homocysteine biosynthesis protein [Methanomicrobiales archaeon]
MDKPIDVIHERIRDGNARVVTADQMPAIVADLGEEGALAEVDVVTTGTFGAMCSSGAFFNFGHSDPPIRMERIWLNDVEAYGGIAAVDAYLGATEQSTTRGITYGGAHVLEDLVGGKSVDLRAISKGTDCYPRRTLTTEVSLETINEAVMCNPRNAYQRYNAAVNTGDRVIHTYMGTLLPNCGNVTYSGAGVLNPLSNDPELLAIGPGVPCLLGGAVGMVVGEGTQHSPSRGFSTLMLTGNLKEMSQEYLRAAIMHGYGTTLYLGVGVPIPVTNLAAVRSTAVRDEDITVDVVDYGIPSRGRPTLRTATYADLRSGVLTLKGEEVRTSSLSSFRRAHQVADRLRDLVLQGEVPLRAPARRLALTRGAKPLQETTHAPRVREIMDRKIVAVREDDEIKSAAAQLLKGEINHLPVLDPEGKLVGIVTTYDISKAVVNPAKGPLVRHIMKQRVITTTADEPVDIAVRKLERYNISALPVIDNDRHIIGMLTAMDLGKLFGGRWLK